ncbi:unnamed protein product [Cercopithifilaria johnstoni]|uniref:Uncharacterized protein n=1 Tax=Cercopithifilaria johnstoni TaxID=2874296 RepID=A0A8J2M174_9BILA|nr:unnamed protein product [Cercopithifilaria johnstoni]
MRDDDPGKRPPSQVKHLSSEVKYSSPQVKSEIIAQHILKKLLTKRSFQKYLIDITVKEVLDNEGSSDAAIKGQHFIIRNLEFESPTSCRRAVIHGNIDLLICHLKLITESFIKSSNLAFCDIGANINRDAASLFSVRLQLEQFLNSDRFQLLRFEQFIRRLYTLLRCFAARISTLSVMIDMLQKAEQIILCISEMVMIMTTDDNNDDDGEDGKIQSISLPFQIANCAFFAICLCDLLYRFEEFCSIHEKNFTSKFEQLQKTINMFHDVVVRRLNEMIATRIKQDKIMKRKIAGSSSLRRTPRRPKSAAIFREVEQELRSPGYLLPHDLQEKRRLMQSRRATTSFSPSKQRFSKHIPQKIIEKEAIHRLAREITNEMINGLAARVDDVVIISR